MTPPGGIWRTPHVCGGSYARRAQRTRTYKITLWDQKVLELALYGGSRPRTVGPCRPDPARARLAEEPAQQGGGAIQVLGHGAPGPVGVAGQDGGHDRGVLARCVVDVAL